MTTPSTLVPRQGSKALVLEECNIDAYIVDIHSLVTIAQTFSNPSDSAANHVTYTFSMLSGAAIFEFKMIRQDGTEVVGIVKEREQAQKEMDAAIAAGQTAAHGEEQTKDIFSIGVGNLRPREKITIKLSYINPLIDDETKDQVRFTIPRAYMERYGYAPTPKVSNANIRNNIPWTMNIRIQQVTAIQSITSPGRFKMNVRLGRMPGVAESAGPDANFATVTVERTYVSGREQDFVLVITAKDLDAPRAFVEPHPYPNNLTEALGITFVPRMPVAVAPGGMEYIVLVDRSGSMSGVKMQMTRATLNVLLQNLPGIGSYINIFSYGSSVSSLWTKSQPYNTVTARKAKEHINGMTANYGGTDIRGALSALYASLPYKLVRPVSIFLLTDGGVYDVRSCMTKIETENRDRASVANFMRVFTVGLGNGVSTETCDGIARAGGGVALYITTPEEKYLPKCQRLVRAAQMAPMTDIRVAWQRQRTAQGAPPTAAQLRSGLKVFDPDYEYDDNHGPLPPVTLPGPDPPLHQAPSNIPTFFPSTRARIFAIVPKGTATTEPKITFTGSVPALGEEIDDEATVHTKFQTGLLIHTSAAKALITELEDGSSPYFKDPKSARAEIVRLGTTYGLTSRYTSFLAVDNGQTVGMSESLVSTIAATVSGSAAAKSLSQQAPMVAARSLFTADASPQAAMVATRSPFTADASPRAFSLQAADFPASAPPDTSYSLADKEGDGSDSHVDIDKETADSKEAILVKLSYWQGFDGDFGSDSASVVKLLQDTMVDASALGKYTTDVGDGLEGEAVLLAWTWMSLCCGIEAVGMREKAELWLRERARARGSDADTVLRGLLDGIAFQDM